MLRRLLPSTLALLPLTVLASVPARAQALATTSPDGHLSISFELKSNPQPYLPGERPYYRIVYQGQPILADSPLGLDFIGQPPLDHDFEIVGSELTTHEGSWVDGFGSRRRVPDHYRQLRVSLRERQAPRRRLDLIFRAYNQGVAFRYRLPQQPALGRFTLAAEYTGFDFARDATAYAINLGRFSSNWEGEYLPTKLDAIKPTSLIGLPLLIHLEGGPWAALLEANLTGYCGMVVSAVQGVPNALMSRLNPMPEHQEQAVEGSTPLMTPWRLLLVSPRPGGLIESDYMVANLNPPAAIDPSWVEPGKSAWDWWSGTYAAHVNFHPGMNTATMEHYIDFAAQHHLPYMLIDAGWSARMPAANARAPSPSRFPPTDITRTIPAIDLPAILAYARQRRVRVLLWLYWTDARDQMDKAFPLYQQWGVAGVKIDFMEGVPVDQENVALYRRLVRTAARYHLIVDIHGAYEPDGLRREYPNLLTQEGVLGMEYSKWSYRATPTHDVTLPFTRMLAGPMDYTPGCFNNATRSGFRPRPVQPMCQGTRAHQLAMYVDFLSPLVMLSDYPEDYDRKPGMEFLDQVPTVWDETRVLGGEPAQYVLIARRRGETWYLGAMTNWDARDLDVPLNFLGSRPYQAEIFADGPRADTDATDLSVSRRPVRAGDRLSVHLASGGGWAAILKPAP